MLLRDRYKAKTGEKPGKNHAQNHRVKTPKTGEKLGQNRGASQPPIPPCACGAESARPLRIVPAAAMHLSSMLQRKSRDADFQTGSPLAAMLLPSGAPLPISNR